MLLLVSNPYSVSKYKLNRFIKFSPAPIGGGTSPVASNVPSFAAFAGGTTMSEKILLSFKLLGLVIVSGLAGVSLLVDLFNSSLGFDLLIPSNIPDGLKLLTLVSFNY